MLQLASMCVCCKTRVPPTMACRINPTSLALISLRRQCSLTNVQHQFTLVLFDTRYYQYVKPSISYLYINVFKQLITEILSSSQSRASLLSEDVSAAIIDESPTSTRKNNNIDDILLKRKITQATEGFTTSKFCELILRDR